MAVCVVSACFVLTLLHYHSLSFRTQTIANFSPRHSTMWGEMIFFRDRMGFIFSAKRWAEDSVCCFSMKNVSCQPRKLLNDGSNRSWLIIRALPFQISRWRGNVNSRLCLIPPFCVSRLLIFFHQVSFLKTRTIAVQTVGFIRSLLSSFFGV